MIFRGINLLKHLIVLNFRKQMLMIPNICPLCKLEINRAQCKKCQVNILERQNLIYFYISKSKIQLEIPKGIVNLNIPDCGQLFFDKNLLVIYNVKAKPLCKTVITPDLNSINTVISKFSKLNNYV